MNRAATLLILSMFLLGSVSWAQDSNSDRPVEFQPADPDPIDSKVQKESEVQKVRQPNPDVPYGGVVLDLNLGRANNTPKGYDNYYVDQGSGYNDSYKRTGDNGGEFSLALLVPIAPRATVRFKFRQTIENYTENIYDTEMGTITKNNPKQSVSTFSLGLRIHIGGSNPWSK